MNQSPDIDQKKYHPEPYWSQVAQRIDSRKGENVIAGDDEPYYRYKRSRLLEMLELVSFKGRKVLEVGCGPGGNLKEVIQHQPAQLTGADISSSMLDLAAKNVPRSINLIKTNGTEIPVSDYSFDLAFTVTVLQHNTDEGMLRQLMSEICRVTRDEVVIYERIEDQVTGDELCMGRPVHYYEQIMKTQGYKLIDTEFININVSYYVCGAIRKLFNPSGRKEGESLNKLSINLQKITLIITRPLDKIFTAKRDLGMLRFNRIE